MLADRCEATERAIVDARHRILAAKRALDEVPTPAPIDAPDAPTRVDTEWRKGFELTALPALFVGLFAPFAMALPMMLSTCVTEAEVTGYAAETVVIRSSSVWAPAAGLCRVSLSRTAPGSCLALVNCYPGGALYRGEVACDAPAPDVSSLGVPMITWLSAQARDVPTAFDYDQTRGTVLVRDAEGGEATLVVASNAKAIRP